MEDVAQKMDFRLPSPSPELPKLWLTHNLIVLGVSLRLSVFFFSRWHGCPTRGPPQSLVYCTTHKVQTTRTWWITQSPLRAPAAALTESLGTFTREMRKHFSFLVLPSRRLKKNETPGHQNFPGHLTGPGRKPSPTSPTVSGLSRCPGMRCSLRRGPTHLSSLTVRFLPLWSSDIVADVTAACCSPYHPPVSLSSCPGLGCPFS